MNAEFLILTSQMTRVRVYFRHKFIGLNIYYFQSILNKMLYNNRQFKLMVSDRIRNSFFEHRIKLGLL
jgi:hypothetical protein